MTLLTETQPTGEAPRAEAPSGGAQPAAASGAAASQGFACHVIPTGVARDAEGLLVSATLSFTPTTDRTLIDNWPVEIEKKIEAMTILLRPAGGGESTAFKGLVNLHKGRCEKAKLNYADLLKALGALWKSAVLGGSGGAGLEEILKQSRVAGSQKDLVPANAAPSTATPDIVTTPRADLALLYALERAKAVADRAHDALTTSPAGLSKPEADRKLSLDLSDDWFARPWARLPNALEWKTHLARLKTRTQIAGSGVDPVLVAEAANAGQAQGRGRVDYDPFRYEPDRCDPGHNALKAALRKEHDTIRPQVEGALEGPRGTARSVATTRRALDRLNPKADGKETIAALKAFGDARGTGVSAADLAKTCVEDPGRFKKICDQRLAVHIAGTMPDDDRQTQADVSAIQQRWTTLRSQPSLLRLFHLVVDVTFRIPNAEVAGLGDVSKPLFLECGLAGASGSDEIWTLCKLNAKDTFSFWPATRAEWRQDKIGMAGTLKAVRAFGAIDQIEGVYDLGAAFVETDGDGKPKKDGRRAHRFDVSSLDMIDTAETTIQEHKTQATTVLSGNGALADSEKGDILGSRTRRTAGLMLLDRWRQSAAVSEFVRGVSASSVKDADDLTIGFKVDVGAFAGAKDELPNWRSLTDRSVTMSLPEGLAIDADARKLLGDANLDRAMDAIAPSDPGLDGDATRRRIDGAAITIPSRLRGNGGVDATGKITAFSEEIVFVWDGDPLGLQSGEEEVGVPADGLPINMTFALANRNAAKNGVPHRLRFGAAYRFGARAVLVGGVSRPLAEAAKLYDGWRGGEGFSLPGSQSKDFRRFLRHERVDAPMVAIAQDHLLAELATDRPPLDGKEMIVRTWSQAPMGETWRYGPAKTSRMLFAPQVSLNFATWHGVFDGAGGTVAEAALLGGLAKVDYDAAWRGFPVLERDAAPKPASVRGQYRNGEAPDKAGETRAYPPSGTAVVRLAGAKLEDRKPENRYYPDPAARMMVIALKRPDGSYLEDGADAICVPLYPDAKAASGASAGYPNAMPVVLTVKADATVTGVLNDYRTLRSRAKVADDAAWPVVEIQKSKDRSGGIHAIEVTITLRPGEDFEVETWCIPDSTRLARWFDVPESLGLLIGGFPPDRSCADFKACLANFTCLTGGEPSDVAQFRRSLSEGEMKNCIKGDCRTTADMVKGVAETLLAVMKRKPIPEIAAVRRLRAVYAVEQPNGAPDFASDPTSARKDVRILRVEKATRDVILAPRKQGEACKNPLCDWTTWTPLANQEDGADILVGGKINVDVESTGGVELRATGAAARGQLMDDPGRGRSHAERMSGDWSRVLDGADETASREAKDSLTTRLFGFDVDRSGVVKLPTQTVRIADWTLDKGRWDKKRQTLDMLDLSRETGVDSRFFADGKARRLKLELYAKSRTALLIPPRAAYRTAEEERDDETRLFKKGVTSVEDLVIRATVRPAAIKARSLLPAFVWKPDGGWVKRTTRIRIRCARPHFTSGVEERWGVVLWPPNLFDVKRQIWGLGELRGGRIRRSEPVASGESQDIDVLKPQNDAADWRDAFFTDDDLGPGGKYVTRWGLDPIRKSGSLDWFLSPAAFFDETSIPADPKSRDASAKMGRPPKSVENDRPPSAQPIDAIDLDDGDTGAAWTAEDASKPRLVENVLMPIPAGEKSKDATRQSDRETKFMQVSLMTYAPRFDPDFEHWYVDVDIAPGGAVDPFLRLGIVRFQPHARRELQCSGPIAEWVQIVGYSRSARVDLDAGGRTVTVKVAGVAPTDAADEARMAFRATLYERRTSALGHVTERVVRRDPNDGEDIGAPVAFTELSVQAGEEIWKGNLGLPNEPGVTYAVLVEEVNLLRPAQYASEPHDDAAEERSAATGPRFAAFLDVPQRAAEKPPVTKP